MGYHPGQQRDQPALAAAGDPVTLTPPRYTPHAMGAAGPFLNQAAKGKADRHGFGVARYPRFDVRFSFSLQEVRYTRSCF
ncbi:hypothetical protein CCR78_08945 [Rhodovulum imhoffii]|nr:hypothetical protein [Rhodovulum imhoffii]